MPCTPLQKDIAVIDASLKDTDGNGEWGKVIKDALIQIHSVVLPDGKVLAFGTDGVAGDYDARFVYSIFDPATGELKVLPNTTGTNIFCSNMAIDPATGNVVIMGGDNHNTGQGGGTWSGRNDVVLFDYKTQTIRNISETDSSFALHQARWYGTTVTLSNGEILMVGGRDQNFNGSTIAEIYNAKTGMRQLTGTEMKDFHDGEGTLTGTYYYPHAWQVSNGSVIIIEAGGTTNANHDVYRMDVSGDGSVAKIGVLPFDTRNLTASIMYDTDKVLVASSTGQVWRADLSKATVTWELAFTIKDEDSNALVARTNGTFVMLPDGRVAMVGGSSSAGLLGDSLANAQRSVLFYDPATGKVDYSEQQDLARMYHSTGLLLPDGTIYSAGSGSPGPQENANFQILQPSYLYDQDGNINAGRPVIGAAPRNVDAGSTFRITVDDTSDIGKISFIKSGATTHARNADTRFLSLDYKVIDGNTVEVTIPKANVAIPGVWMLFAVDKAGAPSVARMVGVDMAPLVETGGLATGPTVFYNIDGEQIDGAFALAVTVRFDDVNGHRDQKVFDLGNGGADTIRLSQVGESRDVEFLVVRDGQAYRLVAHDAIVEGETATWRVGVDPSGVMRISKNDAVIATGQGVVPADVDRHDYVIGGADGAADSQLIGLVRDLKIANYGHFAELDPSAPSSPCAKTGEAVCLCDLLLPNVDDTPGNDAPKVFTKYSILRGDVTELVNGSVGENRTTLTTTGIVAFADADAEPHHATVVAKGADYLGTLTITDPTTAVGVKTGSVTWTFKVDDAALDPLKEGQEVVQYYDITLDDGHGGVTTQSIAVTLRGSNDDGPPTEDQVRVVPALAPTPGNDAIDLGDNVRLLAGANLQGGANSLTAGNYFELRAGNLDFSASQGSASLKTGLATNLSGGDILMGAGGIRNSVQLGDEAKFSLVKMDGNGAGTVNTLVVGAGSSSDAGIDMDGSGTAASQARMSVTLGDGVRIGGTIDADGANAIKTFVFGSKVTIAGDMLMNGAQNANSVTAGDNFTLNGTYTGSATGSDTLTLGKDWNITGAVNLNGGDDTLAIGLSKVDTTPTTFSGGAGQDTVILTIDAADQASFEAAAKAAGWTALGNDQWRAGPTLTWRGMTLTAFEAAALKVVGRNDAPEIVAAGTTNTGAVHESAAGAPGTIAHLTNGTIQFTDPNPGDTHSVTIVPGGAGFIGTIDYVQPKAAQFGLLPWVFSADDADLDTLGEGEVRTQAYLVTIRDDKGATTNETITITLTGSNDAPTVQLASSSVAGAVAEMADQSAGETVTMLRTAGVIAFADVDASDTHRASVAPVAAGYSGEFKVAAAADGKIGWTFQVADGDLDAMGAGEVRTQSYVVTIDDGHGGTIDQTVVVTLTGAADDPVANRAPVVNLAGSVVAGAVTELPDRAAGENVATLSATGSIAFTDGDAQDLHTASVAARATGYVGTLTLGAVTDGHVGWTFAVADAALDRLGKGEVLTQSYDVVIADGRGGQVTQAVVVTLTGAADDDGPANVTVAALKVGAGDDAIVLGDAVTLTQGAAFGTGANSLTTGDGFTLTTGALSFSASTGAATLSLGARADLHGGNIAMNGAGITNTMRAGEGSHLSAIVLNGGGARAAQSVTLGKAVVTDANIAMDGSGTRADRMEAGLSIGDDTRIGGGISMNGSYATKDVAIGDRVTIDGAIGLAGAGNMTHARIGSDVTVHGTLIGSAGDDMIEIGRNWQVDGVVDLGAGNDTLRIGTSTRETGGTIIGGAGDDRLEIVLTADQQTSFDAAASAARWTRTADGGWDTGGRTLTWQGMSYVAFETAAVSVVAGTSATPVATRIDMLQTHAGGDDFILGDRVTLAQGAAFGAGANSLKAGDGFTLTAGALNFSGSTVSASLSLGADAHLNGGNIAMNGDGITNILTAGDGSRLSVIALNGGGAKAAQLVTLGKAVVTDAGIAMGGSGTLADRMETNLTIGDDARIGGAIGMNGSYATKDVAIGDRVTVDGTIGLAGTGNATHAHIGDGLTLGGGMVGSAGNDMIEIGRNWQIDGVVDLGAGNDTLRIGATTRDAAGTISGGAGNDRLEIVMAAEQQPAFDTAASAARWVKGADGSWDTGGRALTWQGVTYTAFETAKVMIGGAAPAGLTLQNAASGATVAGTAGDDFIVGTDHADRLSGGAGNDHFDGGKGDDVIDGGAGRDVVELSGKPADYAFARDDSGGLHVTGPLAGHDILYNVEEILFHGSNETIGVDHLPG